MSFGRFHDEYWAVNLESLGVDIPYQTQKLASHVLFQSMTRLSINSIFYCHKSLSGPAFWTGAMGRIPRRKYSNEQFETQVVYATRISYPDFFREFERAVLFFVYGFGR